MYVYLYVCVCVCMCVRVCVQMIQTVETPCCWVCTPCKEDQYLVDESTCKTCPDGWRPNDEQNGTQHNI